ncbi:MAG: Cytochrome b [uncultured Sphingosinicella sp.]|uniref:Cytochrome b n=1 Tax=uncultured Sphingosinicella sp. TaxID=478748 RepID=A0A6J4UGE1_9SPHN|nr:cytochrome b/b6 domain-containing protein [uncultured Sphingosinicella sp.]CAA9549651.1 MAG: Cytochrome b [uncultured Sphingosinicella sp.]
MRKADRGTEAPVWDVPVRLFHWSVVLLIALSWWSAEEGADRIHFWSGYTLLFLLLFRILWGLAGSSTARFSSFVRSPSAVLDYLRGGQFGQAGHTPLGGLSVVAMLLALLVQLMSGLFQIDDDDFVEGPLSGLVSYDTALLAHDVHEVSFNILLALIALHLLAIGYYQFIRRRSIVRPMLTGRAELPDGVPPMRPAPRGRLAACAAAALVLTAAILGAPSLI